MPILLYWIAFALIWGVLVKVLIPDMGVWSSFWWTNTLGHALFGGLWMATCLDHRFQRFMHRGNTTFGRCISSLFAIAVIWEFAEYFYDIWLRPEGSIFAQKGVFDTVCDVLIALVLGTVVWCMLHQKRHTQKAYTLR